jgi:uncharacterized protein YqeY
MNIQKQIKQDLTAAIKAKDANKKDALRVIMGEFGRLDKKELSDDEAIKIMKKLMKSEKEVLEKKGDETESDFIKVIENWQPKLKLQCGLNKTSTLLNSKTKCKPWA